jgi:flagellar hook assembly protein FlgD
VPRTYSLSQNFPNPFNPTTRISYALPSAGAVSITIYNILGQEVKTLLDSRLHEPGVYSIVWNGRNQSENPTGSGVYFYRIDVRDLSGKSVFTQAKKMLLIK